MTQNIQPRYCSKGQLLSGGDYGTFLSEANAVLIEETSHQSQHVCWYIKLELTEKQNQEIKLNAGLFFWPIIMFLYMLIGVFFGYLFWGH